MEREENEKKNIYIYIEKKRRMKERIYLGSSRFRKLLLKYREMYRDIRCTRKFNCQKQCTCVHYIAFIKIMSFNFTNSQFMKGEYERINSKR